MAHFTSPERPANLAQRLGWAGSGVLWLGLLAGGLGMLQTYGTTAGEATTAPREWPHAFGLEKWDGRPTLVMIAHPRCPCTRASLDELGELLAANPGQVRAQVIFYRPDGEPAEWAQRSLWRTAAALPGVAVSTVEESQLPFGQRTSGTILFYNANGHLAFHGGITAARGEYGPSLGQEMLRALLHGAPAPSAETPVFGCPLTPHRPTARAPLSL